MGMAITIPEEQGGELRVFPGDVYNANIQDLFLGTSKAGAPKVTIKWVITSEYSGVGKMSKAEKKNFQTVIGENVLESFSLQPQAIWKLSSLYKEVTGDKLPVGDFTEEELEGILKNALIGYACKLHLEQDESQGQPRMQVMERFKA